MLAPARSPLDRREAERRGQGAKQTARGRHAGSRLAAGVVHDGPRIDREVTPRPLGGDHEGARPG